MSASEVLAQKTAGLSRPRDTYTIPPSIRAFQTDPNTVTLELYTLSQEIDAIKAAGATGGGAMSVQYELLRRAAVEVDGVRPDLDWVDRTSPAVRMLLGQALDRMVLPSKEDTDSFFNSRKTSI